MGVHTLGEFALRACDDDGAGLLAEIRQAERDQSQRLVDSAIKVHDDATLVALSVTHGIRTKTS